MKMKSGVGANLWTGLLHVSYDSELLHRGSGEERDLNTNLSEVVQRDGEV